MTSLLKSARMAIGLAILTTIVTHQTFAADSTLHLKRVNLVVADLDRALTVYRDILGFQLFAVHDSTPDSYSYPVFNFPKRAKLRFATLDSASEPRSLALTEVTRVRLPKRPAMHLVCPVIRIANLDTVYAALKSAGLKVVEPQESTTPEGARFREMAFTDYDGNLIVLYQLSDSTTGNGG